MKQFKCDIDIQSNRHVLLQTGKDTLVDLVLLAVPEELQIYMSKINKNFNRTIPHKV